MSKGITLALAAVGIAATGFIIYQQKQIERWRADNESLRAQAAAAELQAQNAAAQARPADVMTPAGPDAELLRLRAEVARLRGVEAELVRVRQQIGQTKASSPAPAQSPTAAEEVFAQHNQRLATMTVGMKEIGLALRMLCNDQTATDKSILQNGQLNPKITQALSTIENASPIDWSNVELLVSDAGALSKVDLNTIVARTKPIQTPDGQWIRIYTTAAGVAHRIVHQTPNEVWDGSSVK